MPKLKEGQVRQHREHIRWTPTEYLKVAAAVEAFATDSTPPKELLAKGQKLALPRERWRNEMDLQRIARPSQSAVFYDSLKKFRAMPPQERLSYLPKNVPNEEFKEELPLTFLSKSKAEDAVPVTTLVRWTDREEALIARRVKHWRDNGSEERLSTLFLSAQDIELPPFRRRQVASLKHGDYSVSGIKASNKRIYDDGLMHAYMVEHLHFNPQQRIWFDPDTPQPKLDLGEPAVLDLGAQMEIEEHEAEQANESPGVNIDAGFERHAPEPVEAPIPVQATTPLPRLDSGLGGAALDFAAHILVGMNTLLTKVVEDTRADMVANMRGHIDAALAGMADQLTRSLVTGLQGNIAAQVHQSLEVELGGPVSTPAPLPPPAPSPEPAPVAAAPVQVVVPPKPEPAPQKLVVDVVGMFAKQMEVIRAAINGSADIRFIEPKHISAWNRRTEHVIVANKFAGHHVYAHLKKHGVKTIIANGGPQSVISIIESLREGVPV